MKRLLRLLKDPKRIWNYVKRNYQALLRIAMVIIMFILIGVNYDRLMSISFQSLMTASDKFWMQILIVLGIYLFKGATMVIPASLVYIAVGLTLPRWWAIGLNLVGTVIELAVSYYIGVFAGGDYIRDSIYKTKYGAKFLDMDPKKSNFGMFVCRLLPFLPNDLFSLFYGNIKYPFVPYTIYSMLGMLPNLFIFTILGNAAYKYFPVIPAGISVLILAAIVTIAVGVKTYQDLKKYSDRRKKEKNGESAEEPSKKKDFKPEEAEGGTEIASIAEEGESVVRLADPATAQIHKKNAEAVPVEHDTGADGETEETVSVPAGD